MNNKEAVRNILKQMDEDSVSHHGLHGFMIKEYAAQIDALYQEDCQKRVEGAVKEIGKCLFVESDPLKGKGE